MTIRRVVPNLISDRVEESREFCVTLFGFEVVMDMDWIVTLALPANPTARLSLVRSASAHGAPEAMTLTIEVPDVDAVHAAAVARDLPVEDPLTDEPWGVHRFHLRDPNGVLLNVMRHYS